MFPFDIFEKCDFVTLDEELSKLPFVCGNKDLEDFFHNDAIPYAKERLGKTYCFVNNNKPLTEIVAFVS